MKFVIGGLLRYSRIPPYESLDRPASPVLTTLPLECPDRGALPVLTGLPLRKSRSGNSAVTHEIFFLKVLISNSCRFSRNPHCLSRDQVTLPFLTGVALQKSASAGSASSHGQKIVKVVIGLHRRYSRWPPSGNSRSGDGNGRLQAGAIPSFGNGSHPHLDSGASASGASGRIQ